MKLKHRLQNWLIRHHSNPSLVHAARGIYWAALRLLVWMLSRRREVSTVLLRRGMTRKDWIPGGSDYDLTVVAKEGSADDVASTCFRITRRFNRFWPVPTELSVFSESEMKRYLNEGNLRALEAVKGWRALYGEWNPKPRHREPLEISLHAFSEAIDQLSSLMVLMTKPSLSRAETRHFIKHFVDAEICCTMAETGEFIAVSSRWEWLQERPNSCLLRSYQNNFHSLSKEQRFEAFAALLDNLHRTSLLHDLGHLAPAWTTMKVENIPKQFQTTFTLWQTLGEEAYRRGVDLLAMHLHNRSILVLSDNSLSSLGEKQSELLRLLRLTSLRLKDHPAPLILSESTLRVFSSTSAYQQETFYCPGIQWNVSSSQLAWIKPLGNAFTDRALRSKLCTLPSEIRRARACNPEEASKIERGYLQSLVSRLQIT